ncbi:MAG: type transport system permease protein [Mycobacteriales bacterium]
MSALTKLTLVESKLFLRDRVAVPLTLALPVLLVIAFGLIPGIRDPDPDLSNQAPIELIGAIGVSIALAMLGLSVLPTVLATYRERGILRRLGATPVHPSALLGAQLVVNTAVAVVSMALLVGVGSLAVGLPVPRQLAGFGLAFLLAVAALFTIGLLIAALAPTIRAATGIGMSLFFPSLFLAGVYVPREALPPVLRDISDFTPLGAALQSFRDTWHGDLPRPLHLVTMAGYAVVAGVVAARFFRWE